MRSQKEQTSHSLRKCADKEADHPYNRPPRTLYLLTPLDGNQHAQPDSDWKDGEIFYYCQDGAVAYRNKLQISQRTWHSELRQVYHPQ